MRKSMRLCAALALFVCAPAAFAQNDWAVISTSGDPDPITSFDLGDPSGSMAGIGFVDGNFNRGMDFDSINSFYYYVSTDSLNDPGDRGLWYWNSGVNTQLATQGFSDSGDGDATLSANGSRFYISTDDGDASAGDSIYYWDNLGGVPNMVELGETGLSQIIGLAVNPVSGVMYGYDSLTEALYTISQTDATPTLIGFSGLSISAIGGMDWSADGTTLVLASGDDVYKINASDGIFTYAGDLGTLNVSALSYRAAIPAPGALALLGLAGLASRRRRR